MVGVLWLAVAAVLLHSAAAQTCKEGCPRNRTYYLKHYDELGCSPTYKNSSCCPSSYNCRSSMSRPENKCRYKNTDYSAGQTIVGNVDLPCKTCSCYNTTSGVGFQCTTRRCPVFRIPPHCVEIYEFNSCCTVSVRCRPDLIQDTPSSQYMCSFENKTYFEGEMIPSGSPCKTCLCQRGFNGSLTGPWCRTKSCGLELDYHRTFKQGCVPIYYQDPRSCCPLRWRCPSAKDYVVPAELAETKPTPAATTRPPGLILNSTGPAMTVKIPASLVTMEASTAKVSLMTTSMPKASMIMSPQMDVLMTSPQMDSLMMSSSMASMVSSMPMASTTTPTQMDALTTSPVVSMSTTPKPSVAIMGMTTSSMVPLTTAKPAVTMVSMATPQPPAAMMTTTVAAAASSSATPPAVPTTTRQPMSSVPTTTGQPMGSVPTTTRQPMSSVLTTTGKPAMTTAQMTLMTPAGNMTSSDTMCSFGSLQLRVNDKLSSTSNRCVECTCLVPPLVTCLLDPRCSPWQ